MERWSRCTMFVVTIFLVLAISAIQIVPVLADDGTPPPTETPEAVTPPEQSQNPSPELPPAEVPTDVPVATEAAAATEVAPAATEAAATIPAEESLAAATTPVEEAPAAAEEPAAKPETPAEVLAQVPENTDVVVVDDTGEAVSLATQEAAHILVTGDPIWCPATVLVPVSGGAGCTQSYGSMQALVDYLLANPKTVAGTIWIAKDYDSSLNDPTATGFVLDGSVMPTTTLAGVTTSLANFALTIKGGWNGLSTGTVATNDPSEFNVPLNIINWNGDITLSDIVITGVTSGTALSVSTTKNMTLTRVEVKDNTGAAGADLDNCRWSTNHCAGTGNVTVTSSRFNNNTNGQGISIYSAGTITLNTVTASGNSDFGAILDNGNAATAKNVSLTNGTFEFNQHNTGLGIWSKGAIALKDISANNNGLDGATLYNTAATTAQAVTLTGTNIFSENVNTGLFVQSNGAIKTNNLIANGNGGFEAVYLDNNGATSAQPVIMTGTNEFKFNAEGLRVFSKGAITLNNVTATNNAYGVFLSNTDSGHLAPQNVTLTGYGTFSNNGGTGLEIVTYGAIAVANLEANNNHGYGALLNNYGDDAAGNPSPLFGDGYATLAKTVTLSVSGGNPDTDANNNYSGGLYISSLGAISLSGLNASNNGWDCSAAPDPCTPVANGNGAYLNNNHINAVGGITVSGWGAGTGNNGASGLAAYSKGAITLTNLWTWGNQNGGAILDNSSGTGAVTISGNTGHWSNGGNGLEISSKGAITLLGTLTANDNTGAGVTLNNTFSGTLLAQNVTLSGTSHDFNNNQGSGGLTIYSYGAVTTNNLYASGNNGYGVLIDNCLQPLLTPGTCATNLAKTITLNGDNTFERNSGNGLDLTSKGIITVNNLAARDNSGFGAFFDNQMTGTAAAINVKNTPTAGSEFARNGLDGLRLTSNGTITVMDLDAYQNGQDGVYLNNAGANGVGNIILGTARAHWVNGLNNNFLSGLEVYSNGTVTLSNLLNNDNGSFGLYVDNTTSSLPKAVMLKGNNEFINNPAVGLYILSKGAITLNNISANDSGNGAYVDNTASGTTAPQTITLTGFGDFSNNWNNGLEVYTYGAITLNNVNATNNGQRSYTCDIDGNCSGNGFGVYLDNAGATAAIKPAITLNGSNNFSNNADYGLQVVSLGAIKVNNLDANNNGVWWDCTDTGCAKVLPGFGARLDNTGAGAVGGVTITGHAFSSNNSDYGLWVTSKGAISLNVADAWIGNNGSFGWNLDNQTAVTPQSVTLTSPNVNWGFDFANNGTYGLSIQSLGNITITGLDANNNGTFGATLRNDFTNATGVVTITAPIGGSNDFTGNLGDGLLVYSNKAITIGNLVANDNGGEWTWDEEDPGNPNDGFWFRVWSPVSGVILDNTSSETSSPQNITLTGFGDFHNNGGTGLTVLSHGLITLSNLNISDNGQYNMNVADPGDIDPLSGWGAYLDNCSFDLDTVTPSNSTCTSTSLAHKGITITGSNSTNNNFQDGLWATSLGAITLKQLSASNNGGDGVYLANQWNGALGGVSLTSTTATDWNNFDSNGRGYDNGMTLNVGLEIFSKGAITLNNINAGNNFAGGAAIFGPASVTLSGRNQFNNNGGDGLHVFVTGNITANNLTANVNSGNGAYLNSCLWTGSACAGLGNITLTGISLFRENAGDGIYFDAGGTASLTKVTADLNGNDGMEGSAKTITLTCGSLTRNSQYGWSLSARDVTGLVTLKGVFAYGNTVNTQAGTGAFVYTRACPLP